MFVSLPSALRPELSRADFRRAHDVLLRLYRRGGTDVVRAFLEGEGEGQLDFPTAPLARLEARVVLEEVSRRLPALRLSGNTRLEFPANVSMRGPISLQVAW
jgi:hypothetical protein